MLPLLCMLCALLSACGKPLPAVWPGQDSKTDPEQEHWNVGQTAEAILFGFGPVSSGLACLQLM